MFTIPPSPPPILGSCPLYAHCFCICIPLCIKCMGGGVWMLLLLGQSRSRDQKEIWASQGRQGEKFSQVGTTGNLGW
jgi:hypothetical protein